MSYFFGFIVSIILTSMSYFIGSLIISNNIILWQAFVIGISVVSLGALTEAFNAPIWLIVLIPFPVGMVLLYLFLDKDFYIWLLTYIIVLVLYSILHVIMSYFFKFHSLIPAWKLS